ncbi:tRNA pseudouridine(55) synthase TruB [bacterium]|nr:tRNA pseudouridine(55) synthase TruB [bacterium]
MKKDSLDITGLMNLYKPPNITSFKAADKVKRKIRAKKAGHCGTLDPMADGVLLVCFGNAVRFVDILGNLEKKYDAILKLGEETDTQDKEGVILKRGSYEHLTKNQIEKTFQEFIGRIQQYPPMYSAVKHKGKPLYIYARNGIEIDRDSREVFIKSISIDKITLPFVHFRVTCSKGTFIRTLCTDIGQKLGCYSHLFKLTRTAIGDFRIQDSVQFDEFLNVPHEVSASDFIIPIKEALYFLDSIVVDDENKNKVLNGQKVQTSMLSNNIDLFSDKRILKIIDTDRNLLCVATVTSSQNEDFCILHPKIVINSNNMVKFT